MVLSAVTSPSVAQLCSRILISNSIFEDHYEDNRTGSHRRKFQHRDN